MAYELMDEYDSGLELFGQFVRRVEDLVDLILEGQRAGIHSITGRVKERQSLLDKVLRDRKYVRLHDVTDVCGLRIITYFAEDVDRVCDALEPEFVIDRHNSIDKRGVLDTDQFGYLSVHYVASLSPERLKLAEYSRFEGLKIEIQVRSILQHSWAEIHHDLGYKSKHAVPQDLRRAFSRVAGLLEIADQEFGRIRDELAAHRSGISARIDQAPVETGLDADSLRIFVSKHDLVSELDDAMCRAAHLPLDEDTLILDDRLEQFAYFNVLSIDALTRALRDSQDYLKAYAARRLRHRGLGCLLRGVSVNYLPFALAARSRNVEAVVQFFRRFDEYLGREAERQPVAELLVSLADETGLSTA